MRANPIMIAVAAVAAMPIPRDDLGSIGVSRPDRRNAPPLQLGRYGETASASDLVRLARKNARRRRR